MILKSICIGLIFLVLHGQIDRPGSGVEVFALLMVVLLLAFDMLFLTPDDPNTSEGRDRGE